jgi:serine/threonine protein kinase
MADRYKIYEQLGAGGVGTVFRAYDSQLKRWVAIKRLMITSDARDAANDIQEELRQEADSLASLRHPNIVTIFDVASDDEGLFIVMELLEGEDLADVVARGPLPYDDFKELAYQTLEGLLAAHQRHILHRDIKPENIKAERLPGGRMQAKIIDFGLARVGLRARKQTEDVSGTVLGSIHYMAPEQLTREPVDERTDLYSLGCVFYEALSGRKAFDGPSMADVIDKHIHHDLVPLHAIAPHVPPWLGAWVERLMAPRPEDRPTNAQQAMEEFRAWERMPSMAPYMPWMAMTPEQAAAYYPPQPGSSQVPLSPAAIPVVPDDEAVVAVTIVDERPARPAVAIPARPAGRTTGSQRLSTGQPSSRLGRNSGPLHHKNEPAAPAANRKKILLVAAGAAVLVLIIGFLLLNRKSGSSTLADLSQAVTGPPKVSFELPPDRMMPPLDDDRCLHLVAGVGTLQSQRSSEGKPFPAYANDAVAQWHDLSPRGDDNFLTALDGKPIYAPKRVNWPTAATGPSVKGNRAALSFQSVPTAPFAMSGRFNASASLFPFGNGPTKGSKGLTLAIVFQNQAAGKAGNLLSLTNSSDESLTLQLLANNQLKIIAKGKSGQGELTSNKITTAQPTIAVITWAASGKLDLLALNPSKEVRGAIPTFQGSASSSIVPPASALSALTLGSGSTAVNQQFHGLLGEVILFSSALSTEQVRILGSTQLRSYYFK